MGKEDRGSPVLIFPSNPSASTATAPPQRQRDRCCEDAGENSLLKESFRLQSERNTQSVTWSTFALIGLDMSASSLSLPIFLRINFLISYLDSNRLTEHIRLTHTESFAEWQKAGAGCTSRAFKHPGHDVTAPDVWPSILTDYTYDSELDNADGVPLASRRSSMFPEGNCFFLLDGWTDGRTDVKIRPLHANTRLNWEIRSILLHNAYDIIIYQM